MARTDLDRFYDDVMDDERTGDDLQEMVAQTTNDEPSAAIPIPALAHENESGVDADEDVERGHSLAVDAPLLGGVTDAQRQERERQSVWRNISASVSRLSGDTLWRQTPVDRNR